MRSEVPRTCIGCFKVHDKGSMLRIVKTQEGRICPDESARMNGRGAYICFDEKCLESAVKRHGFERAFKMSVSDEDLSEIASCISSHIKEV